MNKLAQKVKPETQSVKDVIDKERDKAESKGRGSKDFKSTKCPCITLVLIVSETCVTLALEGAEGACAKASLVAGSYRSP